MLKYSMPETETNLEMKEWNHGALRKAVRMRCMLTYANACPSDVAVPLPSSSNATNEFRVAQV